MVATGSHTFDGKHREHVLEQQEQKDIRGQTAERLLLKVTVFLSVAATIFIGFGTFYLMVLGEPTFESMAFGIVLLLGSIPVTTQVL